MSIVASYNMIDRVSKFSHCRTYLNGTWQERELLVPNEGFVRLIVNGSELVKILCTPLKQKELVIGFLYEEGMIESLSDIESIEINKEEGIAQVLLVNKEPVKTKEKIITSGFGKGISFIENYKIPTLDMDFHFSVKDLFALSEIVSASLELYNQSGGSHFTAICRKDEILLMAEDIGRHNTLDKVLGEMLINDLDVKNSIILTSGRISSEMLRKALMLQIPMICSYSSPTAAAVKLAQEMEITLVGYTKNGSCRVYTYPERLY